MKSLKKRIHREIKSIVDNATISDIFLATDPSALIKSPYVNAFDHPRLVIELDGTRYHRVVEKGKIKTIELKKGQILFVGPMCQLELYYIGDAKSMHINFCDLFTLFKPAEFAGRTMNPENVKIFNFLAPQVLNIQHSLSYEGLQLLQFLNHLSPNQFPQWYLKNLFHCLLYHVIGLLESTATLKLSKAELTWKAICSYVNEHSQESINRDTIANTFQLNPNHISRLFQKFSRVSFNQYLNQKRILTSQQLLRNHPEMNIAEIALNSGFSSHKHFNKVFRKIHGENPTAYRMKYS